MFKAGDRVYISGDTSELWIHDYNCRVVTEGTVEVTPKSMIRKFMLRLIRLTEKVMSESM